MERAFDSLSDVVPGRDTWRIKVRVVRIWEVPTFLNPQQGNSIELVLVDEKGSKIHATVRKQLMYLFQKKLIEGEVYKMSYFSVAPAFGSYRTTLHPYKLLFQMKTKVQSCVSQLIPMYGLSFTDIAQVCSHTVGYEYLVDVIGMITGVSEEREYIRDSSITKMVIIEITDQSGKVECALFGEYVDVLKKMMESSFEGLPVIVVQFARIKFFMDKVSIQNVKSTTRILLNPDIPQVAVLKKGMSEHGVESASSVTKLGSRSKPSFDEEFLRMFPKKSIAQLNESVEDGNFVVSAIVTGFVEGEEWWYPACKCHRSVTADSGVYYCKGCVKHVFQMVPRYKVKVIVEDGTGEAVFVLFDNDVHYLLEKSCKTMVSNSNAVDAGFYPPDLMLLKGSRILFKVVKSSVASSLFEGSYRVKRVCKEQSIIDNFASDGDEYTPTKSIACDKEVSGVAVDNDIEYVATSVKPISDCAINLGDDADYVDETQVDNFAEGSDKSSIKRNLTASFDDVAGTRSNRRLKKIKVEKE